jgi:hypothetical protein
MRSNVEMSIERKVFFDGVTDTNIPPPHALNLFKIVDIRKEHDAKKHLLL